MHILVLTFAIISAFNFGSCSTIGYLRFSHNLKIQDLTGISIEKLLGPSVNDLASTFLQSPDIDDAINLINTRLNANILEIDGDLVKIDGENLRVLFTGSVQNLLQSGLRQKPFVYLTVSRIIESLVEQWWPVIDRNIENWSISVDVLQNLINSHRNKRSVDATSPKFGELVVELTKTVIDQYVQRDLIPLYLTTRRSLSTARGLLAAFKVPSNGTLNSLVESAVGLIDEVTSVLDTAIQDINDLLTTHRQRRDVSGRSTGIIPTLLSLVVSAVNGLIGLVQRLIESVVDIIFTPIRGLNLFLKNAVKLVLNNLYPTVGYIVLNPVRMLIFSFIDYILPCLDCEVL